MIWCTIGYSAVQELVDEVHLSIPGDFCRGGDEHRAVRLVDGGLLQLEQPKFHRLLRGLVVVLDFGAEVPVATHPGEQAVLPDVHPVLL